MITPKTLIISKEKPIVPQLLCTWVWVENDNDIERTLAKERPDVIATVGEADSSFPNVYNLPLTVRKKWIHFKQFSDIHERGLTFCMMSRITNNHTDPPLISVFTPSYKSGERIKRPLISLLNQTYKNWEWTILCDTVEDDNGENWKQLQEMANQDYRIRAFQPSRHNGSIGAVKRDAAMLGRGKLLVEMDHDDLIHPDTFSHLIKAYENYPDAGMFYTDFCEIFEEDESNWAYSEFFSFGHGCYSKQRYQGKWRNRVHSSPLNARTLRHIIGVPNHLRVWSTKA